MEGIDISPNMIALAKINAPMADFKVMDCRDVYKIESQYNGIISGFCLPYLSAVESAKFIKDCAALLKNNAVLYFSFVEGEYKKSGFQTASTGDRVYFYFHPLDSLTEALKDNNFEIIKTINTHYQKSSETEEMHTIIIAKKIK